VIKKELIIRELGNGNFIGVAGFSECKKCGDKIKYRGWNYESVEELEKNIKKLWNDFLDHINKVTNECNK